LGLRGDEMKKLIDILLKCIKEDKLNGFLDAISNIYTHTDIFNNSINFEERI
jgi:hypothetical protein